MLQRILADHLVTVGVVNILPKETCSLRVTAVLPHVGCQHLQPWMCAGNPRATLESLRRGNVIMALDVMNESEMEIKMPVVWDLTDATFDEQSSKVGSAGPLRRLLRKEDRAKLVRGLELGIQ